ncbi:hypothetical protein ElyMa_004650400 [Elysia marginata]|uniref:Uncharacterized protein n=1 Tax=Elysia marginata TaxID=1093978 RepID=A0AAV4I179_9GAST|nr:hypothetical protein ElyMa_004650400 [Elysia marginata]
MPATPSDTTMPAHATHSERLYQGSYARDTLLTNKNPDPSSPCHKEELNRDVDLTVSFLGCPSNSTKIPMKTSDFCNGSPSDDEVNNSKQPSVNFMRTDSVSTCESNEPIMFWQPIQGQNNNWCSDTNEEESAENHDDENFEDVENGRESPRSRQTSRNRANGPASCSSSFSPMREPKSSKNSNTEEISAVHQTRKSATSVAGSGRTSVPRMPRSPQRNGSPLRRKKGDQILGSSAPAPFFPTPAQSSFGYTDISRPSSVSPSRKESFARRPSAPIENAVKGPNFRYREAPENVAGLSDVRRSVYTKPPSPSLGASNLHRFEESKGPSHSLAESDLRGHRQASKDPNLTPTIADPRHLRCQLILPDKPWYSGAPHGDIEQTSPQKTWQRLLEHQKQQHLSNSQPRKRSPNHQYFNPSLQEGTTYKSGTVKSLASEVTITPYGTMSSTADQTVKSPGQEDNKTSLSTSCGTVTGSKNSRPRSSRRHPVLDKMFRHVLASLVMESGPPSSACLASVVDQVEGQGTSDSLRSLSRTSSSVSNTNTFTNRLSKCRFGANRIASGLGSHGVPSDLEDDTLPLSDSVPCTLQKINEEQKTGSTTGQREVAVAMADA